MYIKRVKDHSPDIMATATFRQRLTPEIRTSLCQLAQEMLRDSDMPRSAIPFNLDNPGDDPEFHAVVASIAEQMEDHMHDLMVQAITGDY
jgi:hypothetical protein